MSTLHLMSVSLATAGLLLASATAMAITPRQTVDTVHAVRDAQPPIVLRTSDDGTPPTTTGAVAWTLSIGGCHRAIH